MLYVIYSSIQKNNTETSNYTVYLKLFDCRDSWQIARLAKTAQTVTFALVVMNDPYPLLAWCLNCFSTFQADRGAGCQEECALCVDQTSPCQNCLEGNPSATVCDTPETYIFWDSLHFTTEFHQILAEATRQCSKDEPNYDRPFVNLLCPEGVSEAGRRLARATTVGLAPDVLGLLA